MSINDDLKSLIGECYYSDYIHQEHEHELAALLAEDYDELSREIEEQDAWRGSKEFDGILIKKACEHRDCPHIRCNKGQRIGGIEI